jgi:hypothetical protein
LIPEKKICSQCIYIIEQDKNADYYPPRVLFRKRIYKKYPKGRLK